MAQPGNPGKPVDLNALRIETDDYQGYPLHDWGVQGRGVRVVFKQLAHELIDCIRGASLVVGCVAWLTDEDILRELANKRGVAIVVQKEDFLRPDLSARRGWAQRLQYLYSALPWGGLGRLDNALKGTALHMMSYASDIAIDPVRCVGNLNTDHAPAFPRMHHKFLVFCHTTKAWEFTDSADHDEPEYVPYAVWTGSFNMTKNAGHSFENALYITERPLVRAYFMEWAQIAALSEPLDWETPWHAPQWRMGS